MEERQKQYRLIDIILGLRGEYLRIQDELNDIMNNIDVNTNLFEKTYPKIIVRNKEGNIVLEFIYIKKRNKVCNKLIKVYQKFPWAIQSLGNLAYIQEDENGKYQIIPNIGNIINQERFREQFSKVVSFKFLECISNVGKTVSESTYLYIVEDMIFLSGEFGSIKYHANKDIISYSKYNKENHFLESLYMNIPEDIICDYFKEIISKRTKKELIIPKSLLDLIEESSKPVILKIIESEQKVRLIVD